MHGNVINVPTNVNQTQSILPRLPHDGATICVFLKRRLEYKSLYISKNVCSNMMMVALWDLIEKPLYKDLNVNIHHQWANLFTLHINSKSQIPIYNNGSSDNFNSDNEEICCTPTYSMIHNFLDIPKIMDYENNMFLYCPKSRVSPFRFI
jgi:hypothetical protein